MTGIPDCGGGQCSHAARAYVQSHGLWYPQASNALGAEQKMFADGQRHGWQQVDVLPKNRLALTFITTRNPDGHAALWSPASKGFVTEGNKVEHYKLTAVRSIWVNNAKGSAGKAQVSVKPHTAKATPKTFDADFKDPSHL